jgi:hypothetical protein
MRSYGQYCGLARSLEVVGDRWNLLIVRQLLIAPARYRDLIDGLPGIATNLLADRLRDLDAIVRADPASVLGLAAGALTLSDTRALGLVEIDGDESVVRTVFAA